MFTLKRHLAQFLLLGLLASMGSTAFALGVASGTTVTNNITVDYDVGGVGQTQLNTSDSFVVDNLVDVEVDVVATPINVAPLSTDQVITFTVRNEGNTTQGYALDLEVEGGDDFDMTNVRIYIDDGDNVFDAGDLATPYTSGSGNNAGDLVGGDGVAGGTDTLVIHVVADTPNQADGDQADYSLLATTLDAGTTTVTSETGDGVAWDPNTVQVVFGEATPGTHSSDADEDGQDSEGGSYLVVAATLAISKASAVTADPFSAANPKAIPGATIEYTITLQNTGAASADDLSITDTLPDTLVQYDVDTVTVDLGAGAGAFGITDNSTDAANFPGGDVSVATADNIVGNGTDTITVSGPGFDVAGGDTATVTFTVTIR